MTAGQLASVLNVDPGTVSAALRRLEQKKLIERRRDPVDGRRVALGLTPLGRGLDTPAVGTVEAAVAELLASTPSSDVDVLSAALERLTTLVDGKLQS
jgi:DNA-binding MarR family transcriptional regulator